MIKTIETLWESDNKVWKLDKETGCRFILINKKRLFEYDAVVIDGFFGINYNQSNFISNRHITDYGASKIPKYVNRKVKELVK